MGKGLVAIGIAGVGFVIALTLFPGMRDMLGIVDTVGFPTLLASVVTAFPYMLLAFLVFWTLSTAKSSG